MVSPSRVSGSKRGAHRPASRPRKPAGIRKLSAGVGIVGDEQFAKAKLILKHAHESAEALLKAFDGVRKVRGGRGATTDEEQDLLRAMLVLGAAGLDALIKQVIRDVLPGLILVDPKVRQGLETFVARQLQRASDDASPILNAKFLARLLIAESLQKQVIQDYVDDLTGKSLQSSEEVIRAAFALGLDPSAQRIEPKTMQPIFGIRNKIIHELDINFDAKRRNRQSRSRDKMIEYTNELLKTAESFFIGTQRKLAGP